MLNRQILAKRIMTEAMEMLGRAEQLKCAAHLLREADDELVAGKATEYEPAGAASRGRPRLPRNQDGSIKRPTGKGATRPRGKQHKS